MVTLNPCSNFKLFEDFHIPHPPIILCSCDFLAFIYYFYLSCACVAWLLYFKDEVISAIVWKQFQFVNSLTITESNTCEWKDGLHVSWLGHLLICIICGTIFMSMYAIWIWGRSYLNPNGFSLLGWYSCDGENGNIINSLAKSRMIHEKLQLWKYIDSCLGWLFVLILFVWKAYWKLSSFFLF